MPIRARVLAALLCISVAQAATFNIARYEYQPHNQRVLITGLANAGYPIGETYTGINLDCRNGQTTVYTLGPDRQAAVFGQPGLKPDAALTGVLIGSGVVKVQPGSLTLQAVGRAPISDRCQNKVLDTVFLSSPVSGASTLDVPIASGDLAPDSALFGDPVTEFGAGTVNLKLEIHSQGRQYQLFLPKIDLGSTPPWATLQVLLGDGQALYPIFFQQVIQANAALVGKRFGPLLDVFVALDGTHWHKTTLDL